MEWKLWTLAFLLALLNSQLPLFQEWLGGNGILETKECNSTSIKSSHPPTGASEKSYFSNDPRITLTNKEGIPLIPPAAEAP